MPSEQWQNISLFLPFSKFFFRFFFSPTDFDRQKRLYKCRAIFMYADSSERQVLRGNPYERTIKNDNSTQDRNEKTRTNIDANN